MVKEHREKQEGDRDTLLSAARDILETIAKLRRTLGVTEAPLWCALFVAVWIAVSDSIALGGASPIWFGVGWTLLQIIVIHYFCPSITEAKQIHSKTSRVLLLCGLIYIIVTEHIFGLDHSASPATCGIVFQHLPTYLALMVAGDLSDAVFALVILAVLVLPLADTWWRFNNFVIHCCLICFATWVKTKLVELIRQCEALLEVRDVILEVTISQKEKELKDLDKSVKAKEKTNDNLTKQIARLKKEYSEMSHVAEEAVSMMSHRRCQGERAEF